MADTKPVVPPPRRRHRGGRILLTIVLVLVVLVVAAYFTISSSGFVKAVVLPRVSNALNADVTVRDAEIHPFRRVVLHDLKVQPRGADPLLSAPEVRARYHLFDIIRGNINVDDVTVVSPTVTIVENADGTSNLDPLRQGAKKPGEKQPASKSSKSSKPAQVDIRQVLLTNATIVQTRVYTGNRRDTTALTDVTLSLENIRNGQTGKIALHANLKMENQPAPPAQPGIMEGAADAQYTFSLSSDLKPLSAQGHGEFRVARADGPFAELSALAANLNCDVTPSDIKEVALRFQKSGQPLGELLASGPYSLEKGEGSLDVKVLSLDKRVLNLLAAGNGLDFGSTTANATNHLEISDGGKSIHAAGGFEVAKFQVTRTNETTPTLDLLGQYDLRVDGVRSNAVLQSFVLNGTQNGRPLLQGRLTSPMTFASGNASNAIGDSALELAVTNLNLADWKPFIGNSATAGSANLSARLRSQQGGRQLAFDLDSRIAGLTARLGDNPVSDADVTLRANGQASDLKQFHLADYQLTVAQQNQPAFSLSGNGTYDAGNASADLQVTLRAALARAVQLLGQKDLTASSGTAELKARVTQKQNEQVVAGKLTVADFTGRLGQSDFNQFASSIDVNATKAPDELDIRKFSGTVTQAGQPGGSFEISGTYSFTNRPTQLAITLSNFNETGLRPFLQPMLAGKQLVSVAINGNSSLRYSTNGDAAIKADFQVANLVVKDPRQQTPDTPLEARLRVDTAMQNKTADIKQFQIALSPTDRATNQLQLEGHLDFSRTNAIQGSLKLTGNSLDVTRYYDLLANQQAQKKAGAAKGTEPSPGPAPSQVVAAQEPAASQLPFTNFTVDANIGAFYVREVAATNFQTTIKINGNRIDLNPCELTLNGAPVKANANVDLSVPGYKYELAFDATQVPVAPLVNTFDVENKGKIGGTFTGTGQVGGTGTTGESLQKTLTGKFDIGMTNLHYPIVNVKSRVVIAIVNVIGAVPEIVSNPTESLGTVAGALTGHHLGGGGLMEDLKKAPLEIVALRGTAGAGKVSLQTGLLQSSAFEAATHGDVALADVLTNSIIKFPVSISLSRELAQKENLMPAHSTTNTKYARLPDFVTLLGTLGNPDPKINKMALVGTVAKSIGGILPGAIRGTGHAGGGVLQGLGGILGGHESSNTNAPGNDTNTTSASESSTNQNKSAIKGLLNQFLKPK
jgi:hypothetical protein